MTSKNDSATTDYVIAQLTEMFGDTIPPEYLITVCQRCNWDIEMAIENLIHDGENQENEFKPIEILPPTKYTGAIKKQFVKPAAFKQKSSNVFADMYESKTTNQLFWDYSGIKVAQHNHSPCTLQYSEIVKQNNNSSETQDQFATASEFSNPYYTDIDKNKMSKHIDTHPHNYDEIIDLILRGVRVMILMRGLPGSGKSYLSKKIIDRTVNGDYQNHIFSTDDFFIKDGVYTYNIEKLNQAHIWNQNSVNTKATNGWSPIIIDNTNIRAWEMYPYIQIAHQNNYYIAIMEPNTTWCRNVYKLAYINKHNVPFSKLKSMHEKYDETSKRDILNLLGLNEIQNLVLRNNPPLNISDKYQSDKINKSNITLKEFKKSQEISVATKLNQTVSTSGPKVEFEDKWDDTNKYFNNNVEKSNVITKTTPRPQRLTSTNKNMIIDSANEVQSDEFDVISKTDIATNTNVSPYYETDVYSHPDYNDEIVDIDIGINLITKLDSMFGIKTLGTNNILNSFKTNVFMPKTMAKQLYALWLSSMYDQMEEKRYENIKQDELYAKELNLSGVTEKENNNFEMSLKEIVDMEKELMKYESVKRQNKNTCDQDILTNLKIEKLTELFPEVENTMISLILLENKNDFDNTVKHLREMTSDNQFNTNKFVFNTGKSLIRKIKQEKQFNSNELKNTKVKSNLNNTLSPKSSNETINIALKNFEEYRSASMHHSQLRSECYAKAKYTAEQNRKDIAYYYTQIASLHNTKIEAYNHQAANAIIEAHSIRHDNPDLVDLHYLHSSEAIQCLDIFLDQHINNVQSKTGKYLFVITGRGRHSTNGIPIIKNNVKIRLKERNLRYSEVNDGLLRVTVFPNSCYSSK